MQPRAQALGKHEMTKPWKGRKKRHPIPLCYISLLMSTESHQAPELLYCPKCAAEISDPLTCGDCGAVICRKCGTPLEAAEDLGMGW